MELVIKNATVANSKETFKADIHIKDGKIISLGDKNSFSLAGEAEEIDAGGKLIMPGGIDAHTHLDMPFMGAFSSDDFYTGTVAAAFGGTTSIIDYIIPSKKQTITEAIQTWRKKVKNKAVIDYSFHMAVVPPIESFIEELSILKEYGISSIKCFMAYKNSLMLDDSSLFRVLKKCAESQILFCVHAENGEIIELLREKFLREGKTEPLYHALSRPPELEAEAVGRILKLAKLINITEGRGVTVYFVHLSSKGALKEIKRAQKQGLTVFAETCPQYLLLNEYRYLEPDFGGAKFVMSPPLRVKEHSDALLKAVKEGRIDTIATDHCPFNFGKEKQLGRNDFSLIPNGIPCVEHRMPLMFSELVVKKHISVHRFIELTCTNPARIFGLKSKGDILPGMDADIAIWEKDLKWKISSKNQHQNVDYTPFEGFEIIGKPSTVILRGRVIVENNILRVSSPFGDFIER